MKLFIYKIYYVSFLYYSKYKRETPWFSAQMILIGCFASLAIGTLGILGLMPFDTKSLSIPNTSKNVTKYTFLFFLLFLIWKGVSYILYKKLLVSKIDGKSPYYNFNPTKKDKILTLIYVLTLLLSAIIIKSMEIFLFD